MERYLDTRQKSVQSAIATVTQLAATPMAGEMPDLGRSLEAVRTLRAAGERAEHGDVVPPAPTRAK
jgi:uncharacterized protein HemX